MKNLITNHWKRIIIIIGGIFICLNFFSKLSTNKTLLSDYIKYGKEVEKIELISGDVSSVVTMSESPFSGDMLKIIIILIASISLVVFLTSLGDKAAADAKAKKK